MLLRSCFALLLAGAAAPVLAQAVPPPAPVAGDSRADVKLKSLFHNSDEASLRRNPLSGVYRGDLRHVSGLADIFSDALFKEVRPDGIRVTCVMPGSVETNFNGATPGTEPDPYKMQPEDIADAIIHALEAPEVTMISEIQLRPANVKK